MKPLELLMLAALMLPLATPAQDLAAEDPVVAAIEAFNKRQRAGEPGAGTAQDGQAGVVSGPVDLSDVPLMPEMIDTLPPDEPAKPKGLEVRVQNIRQGKGPVDPETVHLLAPFPAKPLDEPPAGWRLESSDAAPAFKREVELEGGKSIILTIRPHLLVPEANGSTVLAVHEPGFEASLGYRQSDTVSAVLSDSIHSLEKDSRQIGGVIDQLQQLIVSLPVQDPPAPGPAATTPSPDKP